MVPEYETYTFPKGSTPELPVDLPAYRTNASLAIQLSHAWLRYAQANNKQNIVKKKTLNGLNGNIRLDSKYDNRLKETEEGPLIKTVPNETVKALSECRWPGRYHVIRSNYATFYLDGAHTKESMDICAKWFLDNNR